MDAPRSRVEREMKGRKSPEKSCINEFITILSNRISIFLGDPLGSCRIYLLRTWEIGDIYQLTIALHKLKFARGMPLLTPKFLGVHAHSWATLSTLVKLSRQQNRKNLMHSGLMWDTSHMQGNLHHKSIQIRWVKRLWHVMIIISSNS